MEEKEVQIALKLVQWFRINKRNLPWRKDKNPYKIWISEIMLQQTKVSTVIPYYVQFLERFPTIKSLAEAILDDVYQVWQGLGYYTRAKKLHETAQLMVAKYGGEFPATYEEVLKLPGVGDYTAGAIMSIAYGRAYPAVDGNVLRVFARLYNIQSDVMEQKTKKEITELVIKNIYKESPSDYTESIMELGALLCQPKNPKCMFCPVQADCLAYQAGTQESIPLRINKTVQVEENLCVLVIQKKDALWMEKRKDDGLLGGFWQLPNFFIKPKQSISEEIEKYVIRENSFPFEQLFLFKEKYIYSHRIWLMEVYEIKLDSNFLKDSVEAQWIDRKELKNFPIGGAFRKIIKRVISQ